MPWYRKNWFAILSCLCCAPAMIVTAATGPIYYERNGELRTYSNFTRWFLVVVGCLSIIAGIARSAGAHLLVGRILRRPGLRP